jgi:hypothetical protein
MQAVTRTLPRIGVILTAKYRNTVLCGMTDDVAQSPGFEPPYSLFSERGRYEDDSYRPPAYRSGWWRDIYIFRDEERGSRVSLAHAAAVGVGKWTFTDLTNFPVDAWEPSHDTELWKQKRRLHLFVQHTKQGDGERRVEFAPQPVYVLEVVKPKGD